MIKLYTINCPKCKILETKLDQKNIKYEKITDMDTMKNLGIQTAPMLEVDNNLLTFADAVKYINQL